MDIIERDDVVAVVTLQRIALWSVHVEVSAHGFVVRYALGIGTLDDTKKFVGQGDGALLHNLVVAYDAQRQVGTNDSQLIEFLVSKELVGYLDDALRAQFLTLQVVSDGHCRGDLLEVQQVDNGEQFFGGNMVYYGTVLDGGYQQLLLIHHSIL